MFIGHFALAFAAKRATPRLSLATLFAAAQLADMLWPLFLLLGVEHVRIDPGNTAVTPLDFVSYPVSHSLLLLAVWGVMFGLVCRFVTSNGHVLPVIAGLVVSHWALDALTHRPDMPLYPGGPKVGLGLWNSVPATVIVESGLFAAGLGVYLRTTRAKDAAGRWGLGSLALILVLVYLANLVGGAPPSVPVLAATGVVGSVLLTWWSWWADRHRQPV